MNHGIYIIEHTASAKRYVGSAVDLDNRIASHLSLLRSGKHPNRYLQSAWHKHGEGAFKTGFLEFVQNKEELIVAEQGWMDALQCVAPHGYNLAPRAGSSLGVVHTPEYCKRMGERKRGNKYRLGAKLSEESKRRIGEKSKGRVPSPENLAKRSASMKGKKNGLGYRQSQEEKARRSEALKVYYASPERRELQRKKWLKRYGLLEVPKK